MTAHCKAPSHLQVELVVATTNAAGPGDTLARYLAQLECPNASHYNGWGVELVPVRKGEPIEKHAMRLLPAAVAWLPGQLVQWADEADADHEDVALLHTFAGLFRTWRTFTPDGARDLAAQIEAAATNAPPTTETATAPPPAGR